LESVFKIKYPDFHVILVDNGSQDGTVGIVQRHFPEVEILHNPVNKLTAGNNMGIRQAWQYDCEFVMVLNPDTEVESNLLKVLVKALQENVLAGAAGPKLKFLGGKRDGLINSTGLIYDGFRQAYDRGFGTKDTGQFDKLEKVFGVSGACILYRTAMLKQVGLYWERIAFYLDELELFMRSRKQGWEVLYVPTSVVWHKYMGSSGKDKLVRVARQKNWAWLNIAFRHYPWKSKLAMLKQFLVNYRRGDIILGDEH
jgi:hypothetical protein